MVFCCYILLHHLTKIIHYKNNIYYQLTYLITGFHNKDKRNIKIAHTIIMSTSPRSTTRRKSPRNAQTTNNTNSPSPSKKNKTKTKLKIKIKRWHGVAKWTWGVGDDEDDVCIVCQSAFEGVAPGVKFPGDECPVVWGKCGHAFHLQCVSTWLQSQNNANANATQTCPTCRQEWEFSSAPPRSENI